MKHDYEKHTDQNIYADSSTSEYYSSKASFLAEKYAASETDFNSITRKYNQSNPQILDIGCGSGRDLAKLQKSGFQVTGVDSSSEMLKEAAARYQGLEGKLIQSGLPGLPGVDGKYNEIICSAVLQHINDRYLYKSFERINELLEEDGIFIISFALDYPGVDPETNRDSDGRLFIIRSEERYRFFIERQGFRLVERITRDDSISRSGIRWAVHVYRENSLK